MFLPSNITLKFGDSGDFVAELQRRLAMVGCFTDDAVNGFYDGNTTNGVTRFQAMNGLSADGVAGPETLRRLNGVIAGDSSATSDKKEEETKALDQTLMVQTLLHDQQHPQAVWQPAPQTEAMPTALSAPEIAASPAPIAAPLMQEAPARAMDPELTAARTNDHSLAAMLMADLTAPTPQAEPQREPVRREPLPPQPPAPFPQGTAAAPMIEPTAPPMAQSIAAQPTASPEPQGIVGKAKQFASGMMQKLSEYFEAKLPPSVLKEVQAIGVSMAQSGMKETPIPTGPELGGREQLPSRGPEQQPQIQRS